MKYKHLIFYVLISAGLIFACQGEMGDPGPKGDQGLQGEKGDKGDAGEDGEDGEGFEKKGFFQGTASGTRRDGTPFNEAFNFEYGPTYEGINQSINGSPPTFEVYRNNNPIDEGSYFYTVFNVINKGTANENLAWGQPGDYSYYGMLSLAKEISPTTLFVLSARPRFEEITYTSPVDLALNNEVYKFVLNQNGQLWESVHDQTTNTFQYVFKTIDGKIVFYEVTYENYDDQHDYQYGNLIKVLNTDGTNASPAPYNQLRISLSNIGQIIFRNLSGVDLSEEIIVPADTYQITNYARNAQTGVV
ncbi:MAG: hypothetical protein O9262_03480, partial [Cyclobacteriaceae bacterium]|nr:hypothetical protein [Cyclobacteriaceae bacterium]